MDFPLKLQFVLTKSHPTKRFKDYLNRCTGHPPPVIDFDDVRGGGVVEFWREDGKQIEVGGVEGGKDIHCVTVHCVTVHDVHVALVSV